MAVKKATTAQEMRDIYQQLSDELYRTFDFFNTKFTEGKLPRPVITVAGAGKLKAHGYFSDSQWKVGEDNILHEIVMCGESLNRPVTDSIGTLIHEMAHLANFVELGEIKDYTPQQRHNQIFKKKAEEFKLDVTSSKRFGPAHTTPNAELVTMIAKELQPNSAVYEIYRENMQKNKEKKKYKSKLKPVMVGEETKLAIEEGAKEMGMSQKDFAQAAVSTFRELPKNMKTVAELIFENRKKFKNAAEIEAMLTDGLLPTKEEVPTTEEVAEETEA